MHAIKGYKTGKLPGATGASNSRFRLNLLKLSALLLPIFITYTWPFSVHYKNSSYVTFFYFLFIIAYHISRTILFPLYFSYPVLVTLIFLLLGQYRYQTSYYPFFSLTTENMTLHFSSRSTVLTLTWSLLLLFASSNIIQNFKISQFRASYLCVSTGCFTIVETKRQLLKPLSMTLFIFLFPDCHREIVNLSIY